MIVTDADGGKARRQSESLAARQARVGIVANPHKPPAKAPAPREVWVRWPDLRSARRCKDAAQPAPIVEDEMARMDAFVRSVRRAAPAPDPSAPEEDPAPARSWGWLAVLGLVGILALAFLVIAAGMAAAVYL